ncbi:MAG: methylase [Myxococcaceae bacterium]
MKQRTRAGRLAALDAWLLRRASSFPTGLFVDVGYGESAVTTLEWARSLRTVNPSARVVGLDLHAPPALPSNEVELHQGGFEACARFSPAAVVRAMNVLRGYREEEVAPARAQLSAGLAEGGVLIEGSTDTDGHVLVAWVQPKQGARSLLFHTDFERGFSPWLFRDWLPRDLRRGVKAGTAVFELLTAWEARAAASGATSPAERFARSLDGVPGLEADAWERAHGFARWVP